jgi:lysophospholipase L1-like esterase
VIDPLSNMTPELAQERLGPFVAILRRARPNTPILLVGCITYSNGWLHKERGRVQQARSAAMRQTYDQLVSQGMSGLHYLPGEGLLSEDAESTVDGTHPTDLGFAQMAGAMEPALRRLLAMPSR